MFNKPSRSLAGNKKKEKTRDELLAEVKAQRAARSGERQRANAVTSIQAAWRGHSCRKQLNTQLLDESLAEIAPLVIAEGGKKPVDAVWVAGWLIPRLLHLLPIPADKDQPINLNPSSGGTKLKFVRAALALLMRSTSASTRQHNYLAYGIQQKQQGHSKEWLIQVTRLARLCCSLINPITDSSSSTPSGVKLSSTETAATSGDTLVNAAAVRILTILTDVSAWKASTDDSVRQSLVESLLQSLAQQPLPLMSAATRCCNAEDASTVVCASPTKSGVQQVSVSPATKLLAIVIKVLAAEMKMQGSPASPAGKPLAAWPAFITLVFSNLRMLPTIAKDTKDMLSSPDIMRMLCSQLLEFALNGSIGSPAAHAAKSSARLNSQHTMYSNTAAIICAANLTLLTFEAQPPVLETQQVSAADVANILVPRLQQQQLIGTGRAREFDAAVSYCTTCASLLARSAKAATAWSNSEVATAATALGFGLWPLAQRHVIMGLLDTMSDRQKPNGMPVLAALWSELIGLSQDLPKRLSAAGLQGLAAVVPSALSAISFTPGVLPKMWCWLAWEIGLPLEAPREASRGLAVAALRGGYQGLQPSHALVFGLFSRLYHHLLQVVDDDEFHTSTRQQQAATSGATSKQSAISEPAGGLAISQARAVVTSLNTLVYHTYLPQQQQPAETTASRVNTQAPSTASAVDVTKLVSGSPDSLLSVYSPMLLRSLYERDTRRSFCQPQLWLAPYNETFGKIDAAVASCKSNFGHQTEDEPSPNPETPSTLERGSSSVRGFFSRVGSLLSSSTSNEQGTSSASRNSNPSSQLARAPSRPGSGNTATANSNVPQDSIWVRQGQQQVPSSGSHAPSQQQAQLGIVWDGLASALGFGNDEEQDAAERDPRTFFIGPFRMGNVVRALLATGSNQAADDDDDADTSSAHGPDLALRAVPGLPALTVRAAEGARPDSLASLLKTAPQAVPFERRVELFRALLAEDKAIGRFDRPVYEGGVQPIKVTIRRSLLMDDAYRTLSGRGADLRARLVVSFLNDQGLEEAGLDYGGLMKEFLEQVVVRGFHADAGLWATCPDSGLVYPRPNAYRMESGVQLLEFLGQMVGKALYEGILLNVCFAPFFVTRLQGRAPQLDDLRTLDPALHKSLMQVKNYDGDVSDLCLTFSVEDDYFGKTTQYALLPGQANTPVTNENKLMYCHLLADWHLNVQLGRAAEAFSRGLACLIPPASLRLFSPQEFNQLVSGGSDESGGGLSVADMKRYVKYSGGYHPDSNTIKLLWQVVSEFTPEQRGKLLRFCTSCSRAPLGGFRYLQPPLTIHKVDCSAGLLAVAGGQDVDRLPSASTCFNTLKLPNYRRKDTLRTKLLYAITSNAGFELS